MARNVYYTYDFETRKILSHKQFSPLVYYFMDGAQHLSIFRNKIQKFEKNLKFYYEIAKNRPFKNSKLELGTKN